MFASYQTSPPQSEAFLLDFEWIFDFSCREVYREWATPRVSERREKSKIRQKPTKKLGMPAKHIISNMKASLFRKAKMPSCFFSKKKAENGSRTHDLPLTKRLLYQLSYLGISAASLTARTNCLNCYTKIIRHKFLAYLYFTKFLYYFLFFVFAIRFSGEGSAGASTPICAPPFNDTTFHPSSIRKEDIVSAATEVFLEVLSAILINLF